MSTRSRQQSWPTLDQLWGIATIALIMLRVQLTPIVPNDFWWHIATGRLIATSGSVPVTDHFSYTQYGTAYYNQPWLAQLLMYGTYQLGGAALLAFLQALVVGGSFAMLYLVCQREGAGARLATLATLGGTLVAMDNWQIRPQTYAVPLFVATLSILLTWRRSGRGPLWILPLLMLVWVNLHGTFTLLLVLCGIFWLGAIVERRWYRGQRTAHELASLTIWSFAALLMTLFNPRGIGIYRYVAGLLGDRAVGELVTEWASPFHDPSEPMTIVFFALLAIFLGVVIWRRPCLTPTTVLLILPFLLLALQSVRNILWLGIVAGVITAQLVATERTGTPRRRTDIVFFNRLIAGMLALMLVATLPWWKEGLGLPPKLGNLLSVNTPGEATAQLRELPDRPSRLFHEMGFGSYLIWAAPEQRVFIDPRIELYSYEQWRDYINLGQGKQIDELAQKYGFDGWLVSPELQPNLVAALDEHPDWQREIVTEAAVYFGPRATAGRTP